MEPMPGWEEGVCAKTAAQDKEAKRVNKRMVCTKELSGFLGRSMANWREGGKKAVRRAFFHRWKNRGGIFHSVENFFPQCGKPLS